MLTLRVHLPDYDAANHVVEVYINGTLQLTMDGRGGGAAKVPSNGHLIFGRGQTDYYSTCVIDEFSVWDSYLSDGDLQIMFDYFMNL